MKRRDKYLLGGIIVIALTKIPNLGEQTFDIAGLIGLVVMGSLVGFIAYLITGGDKKKGK